MTTATASSPGESGSVATGRARPEWAFDTGTRGRRCHLQCHRPNGSPGGVVMNGDDKHRYTPPAAGDIQ